MAVRVRLRYKSTFDFGKGDHLNFDKPLAHALEWLYDENNFEDEGTWLYCMEGVLPLNVMMSIVTDFFTFALQEYAEINIKDYILHMEEGNHKHRWDEDKPYLRYDGDDMILGEVHTFTSEVILWAAYLYTTFRADLEENNEKFKRAKNVLYKLFRNKTCREEEFVKDTFLMKHFNETMVVFLKNIPTHSSGHKDEKAQDDTRKQKMEESVLNYISANNIRYYYEGWRNGKHGAICQWDGIYRFVEQVRGKSGVLDDVKGNQDDNPIVATGIVAYWLQFNSRMDTVIKRLTKYKNAPPKDIRELFANYTKIRFEQFRNEHRDDPNAWDWDWEFEFYDKVIIPQEIALNKRTEALFDYISDSDITLVCSVMKNYIKYLKKTRTEKGYQISPELLVLRAVDSQDETKYEDLEDYEVNTILDKLEKEGYIKVAWIEGHRPEGTRMLDKGRVYLKKLEEGTSVMDFAPVDTQQPSSEEFPTGTPSQMTRPDNDSGYEQEADDEEWDNQYDSIFDKRIDVHKVILQIKQITSDKVTGKRRWYIFYRVFKYLEWTKVTQKKFIKWVIHYYGWEGVEEFRGVQKEFIHSDPPNWNKLIIKGKDSRPDNEDLGQDYYSFAEEIRDVFVNVDDNGGLHDKDDFLVNSKQGGVAHHNSWK